ncbi:MAG: HlyD family type I secretion periplasmic adaptor subunit [Cyanobacteria bacterium P01_F01_bin.53]
MTSTSDRSKAIPSNGNGHSNGQFVMNGAAQNGNGAAQNGNGGGLPPNGGGPEFENYVPPSFDKPVILRQSPLWTKMIVWAIMGVTSASVLWACLARVDESIGVQGKLEPEGVVQLVQAPVGGVVEEVLVKGGDTVEKGQVVATLDEASSEAQLKSNNEISQKLRAENDYYRSLRAGSVDAVAPEGVSPDLVQRSRDLFELKANNRLFRAQISGDTSGLDANQLDRLNTSTSRLNSQQRINSLQTDQLREQLGQTKVQLTNAESDLATNEEILTRLDRLFKEGAVAELSLLQQEQEVNNKQTEVNTLTQEAERLSFQITQAEQELNRTSLESRETLQDRIAVNDQRIAEIESQLNQRILENDRQLSELEGQRAQLDQNIKYQELKAPVSGTVFNLKANRPGYVVNSTEPLMEIVPEDALVARIFIPSKDIGFVKIDQQVDVRIDAFPYSEYSDIKGTLTKIGTDALPPDEVYPFFRFPAEVVLEQQAFPVTDQTNIALRSGMSLSANIKLRKRRVITFFTDLFVNKIDSVTSGN